MNHGMDLDRIARDLVDGCAYMTLATADASGRPWASPVYFAHDDYARFVWVSAPGTTHSRNIAARPQIAVSIYDSHVPVGQGQGVYVSAEAGEVEAADRERLVGVFSERSQEHVGRAWASHDVIDPAPLRLFCAHAKEISVLDPDAERDVRVAVRP